jgi:hypothetical protein
VYIKREGAGGIERGEPIAIGRGGKARAETGRRRIARVTRDFAVAYFSSIAAIAPILTDGRRLAY